jgi:subtilisin
MRRQLLAAAAAMALAVGAAAPISADPGWAPAPQSFIVVLESPTADVRAEAASLARGAGGSVGFVYEHALAGFQLWASPQAARALAKNPNVASVEPDQRVTVAEQSTPTGVERIYADANAALDIDATDDLRVDVDVAVIDTGIDLQHPDLNVVGGVTCSLQGGGAPWSRSASCSPGGDDDHYHGTHVGGTVGALDNDAGVVGVAPGARLWAVKVLDSNGSGWESQIVAGIDWVAANAGTIEVANMSLGGSGFSQAEYQAIQGAVDRGVAFAVAAGNDSDDAANYSPAAFDNALTVSALADFDGSAGGTGTATCRSDEDDTLANFSNFGSAVQIAAPGVCIESTYPLERGGSGTISGTSMASPHVAGALALLASSANPSSASDVAALYNQVITAGNSNWTDDSGDGTTEPLLDVRGFGASLIAGGGGTTANSPPTASFSASCTDLTCSFDAAESSDPNGDDLSYEWTFEDGTKGSGETASRIYQSAGTYPVQLTVNDGRGGTDSVSQDVTATTGGSSGVQLVGDATGSGRNWTATVIVTGGATQGTWSTGAAGGCDPGAGECSFSLTVRKNVASLTYTDAVDPSVTVTIARP